MRGPHDALVPRYGKLEAPVVQSPPLQTDPRAECQQILKQRRTESGRRSLVAARDDDGVFHHVLHLQRADDRPHTLIHRRHNPAPVSPPLRCSGRRQVGVAEPAGSGGLDRPMWSLVRSVEEERGGGWVVLLDDARRLPAEQRRRVRAVLPQPVTEAASAERRMRLRDSGQSSHVGVFPPSRGRV